MNSECRGTVDGTVDGLCEWRLWMGTVDGDCGWRLWMGTVDGNCSMNGKRRMSFQFIKREIKEMLQITGLYP